MQVWIFQSSGSLKALCADESGTRLPVEHGPWTRLRSVNLDQGGDDENEAKSLIGEHGYCCFHDADD
ncbi:hypothetical protein LK533_08095 [Sphingomonas sp. PL-96]|uniref:hypothetical protein n=1 Tax=Sphingomonas sp. PL-96 TaxID=2887201 RepID=UPI001E4471E0|nr:hypothetical protein [Sphingomonas sp. PL-96]MCC2976635.1 hypothetical protein [Sphingomonas sp. PL-96]